MFPADEFLADSDKIFGWWNTALERAGSDEERERVRCSMTQVDFIYQCFSYEGRYVNGDEESRQSYMKDNHALWDKMVRYDIGLNESHDNAASLEFNITERPTSWAK